MEPEKPKLQNPKARGIQVGTCKYLVLDPEIYDYLKHNRGEYCFDFAIIPGPRNHFAGLLRNNKTKKNSYAHDLVLSMNGISEDKYEYVEFLETFGDLIPDVDYDKSEIINPPLGQCASLDCRLSNLRPVSKDDVQTMHTSQYHGVTWEKDRKMWRAFITSAERGGHPQKNLRRFPVEITAARYRDLECYVNGIPECDLNFPASDYIKEDGFPVDPEDIRAIRYRTDNTAFGYEAAVFDDPNQRKPLLVRKKFYSTRQEADQACILWIKAAFGPLSEGYCTFTAVTTLGLASFCEKCMKPQPVGFHFALMPTPKGSLKVCLKCFNEHLEEKEKGLDGDMPTPELLIGPKIVSNENYKKCKQCGQLKPATGNFFKPYTYKGETKLRGKCKQCGNAALRNRRNQKQETKEETKGEPENE